MTKCKCSYGPEERERDRNALVSKGEEVTERLPGERRRSARGVQRSRRGGPEESRGEEEERLRSPEEQERRACILR